MPNYIHFDFNTKQLGEPELRLYPISCMHAGASQCDVKFIKAHIQRLKEDPAGRWVYMGDGGECVTRLSKGDVFGQLLSPTQQQDMILDLLAPVKEKGLFGILGNHGARIYKETGLDFDHTLMARLGVPYLGIAVMANMVVNRSSYDMYFHHGVDSGITLRSKISKAEEFGKFIDADALFTAHSHVAIALQPSALISADNAACKTRTKLRCQYICGSAYDSRTGYAEAKGYPPLLPSWLTVGFSGKIAEGRAQYAQNHAVYRSDGKYELNHDYILDYMRHTGE